MGIEAPEFSGDWHFCCLGSVVSGFLQGRYEEQASSWAECLVILEIVDLPIQDGDFP